MLIVQSATTSRVGASVRASTLKVSRAPLCVRYVVLNNPPASLHGVPLAGALDDFVAADPLDSNFFTPPLPPPVPPPPLPVLPPPVLPKLSMLPVLPHAVLRMVPMVRGLHSSTFRLNVSHFGQ